MKTAPRNKLRKVEKVNLNTSSIQEIYRKLMKRLDTNSTPLDLLSFANPEFSDLFFNP